MLRGMMVMMRTRAATMMSKITKMIALMFVYPKPYALNPKP